MKKHVRISFIILIWAVMFLPAVIYAGIASFPESVTESSIFVFGVIPGETSVEKISVSFDSEALQFIGTLQNTPDLQIVSEGKIEIKPENQFQKKYELKFLPLKALPLASIEVKAGEKNEKALIRFVKAEEKKSRTWVILVAGIILFIIGLKVFRYQKKAPDLMSTKSLFMNFEELEKARKEYFDSNSDKQKSPETKAEETKTEVEKVEDKQEIKPEETDVSSEVEETPVSQVAEKTKQQKTPDLELREEDSTKVTEPDEAKTVPAPGVSMDNKTIQKSTVLSGPDEKTSVRDAVTQSFNEQPLDEGDCLVCVISDSRGNNHEGRGSCIKIGRKKDNDIVLTASEISRYHVEIYAEGATFFLRVKSSSNVTKLNGSDVKNTQEIKDGDTLNLGGSDFKVSSLSLKK
jgi:hypothetical protein